MTSKLALNPPELEFIPGLSRGVRVGDFIFVSGAVPVGADGQLVGRGDAAVQANQCLDNIGYVLREAGADLTDVVKFTCYTTDVEYSYAYIAAKRARMGPVPAAATSVIIKAFRLEGVYMEVEAIAYAPKPASP